MQIIAFTTLLAVAGFANALPVVDESFDNLDSLPFVEERASAPPAAQVQLLDLTYGGTGCPANSVTKSFSSNKDLVTLLFDQYTAESGPNIPASKSRSACQLTLKMKYPQGWQFGVFKADYRGYVNLEKGSKGSTKATYYFSGSSQQLSRTVEWKGPVAKEFTKTDEIGVASTVWSPCGAEGMLNIKTSVDISAGGNKKNLIGVDSADLKYTQKYALQWRPCKK